MSPVVSLLERKIAKMDNNTLFFEAARLGSLMERQALEPAIVPWARLVFQTTFNRATDPTLKHNCRLAWLVLRFYK